MALWNVRKIASSQNILLDLKQITVNRRTMLMSVSDKLSIVGEFWAFMRVRKKWWLGPIVVMLLLLSLLLVLTEGSVLAPFIYTLF